MAKGLLQSQPVGAKPTSELGFARAAICAGVGVPQHDRYRVESRLGEFRVVQARVPTGGGAMRL
jgi:hypothetical protein